MRFIHQPGIGARLGDYLREQLQDKRWNEFRAAIAFIKYTGVRYIERKLSEFGERGKANIIVGIDQRGTSYDGLMGLLNCVGENGEVWVFHNENQSTFHPKVYVFSDKDEAEIVVGSGNMTEGGLFTNYEASLALQLDFSAPKRRPATTTSARRSKSV